MDATYAAETARQEFEKRLQEGLVVKPISVRCGSCGESTSSGVEWVCGSCSFTNVRTSFYSFLNVCQQCGRAPDAFACAECASVNHLDVARSAAVVARRFVKPIAAPRAPRPKVVREPTFEERKTGLEQNIVLSELEQKLRRVSRVGQAPVETPGQREVRLMGEFVGKGMSVFAAAKQVREQLAAQYKDDPDEMERVEDLIRAYQEAKSIQPS